MKMKSYALRTPRQGFVDITAQVRDVIRESGVTDGLCLVYCPHTTAGITINENADPDVVSDLLLGLDAAFPDRAQFAHAEGNSAAHLKAGCIGSSVTLIVENGDPVLGTWQGVYFCEFDGPRSRTYHIKVIKDC